MRGIDLNTYQFDYDLTLAMIMMNADGTVYHRYGARNHTNSDVWLSLESLMTTLQQSLSEHRNYQKSPNPPASKPARYAEDLVSYKKRAGNKSSECIHCHTVNEIERDEAQARGEWKREDIWNYPDPERLGIRLLRDDQTFVQSVADASPAARAGLQAGDRIHSIQGAGVLTIADVTRTLHTIPFYTKELLLKYYRNDKLNLIHLPVTTNWKAAPPLEFSWRPSKWGLHPNPGFGGNQLSKAELKSLNLPDHQFAIRIGYLIDFGRESHLGENAKKAGVRKGDVVLSVDKKAAFASHDEFQAWFRIECYGKKSVNIEILRNGEKLNITLPLLEK